MLIYIIIIQVVPIPNVEHVCKHGCCVIRFCPLVSAFARTIHSFQGQEDGPGKPVPSLIVNHGSKGFESKNPGTLYCCLTRAATIGTHDNMNSAIYFTGAHMCINRIKNLAYDVNGKKYGKVKLQIHKFPWEKQEEIKKK